MREEVDRPVVVVGLARSGVAAASFLARRGAAVVAVDRKAETELPADVLALRAEGIRLETGEHRRETFTGAAMVVVSPGVPWELPALEAARASGLPKDAYSPQTNDLGKKRSARIDWSARISIIAPPASHALRSWGRRAARYARAPDQPSPAIRSIAT